MRRRAGEKITVSVSLFAISNLDHKFRFFSLEGKGEAGSRKGGSLQVKSVRVCLKRHTRTTRAAETRSRLIKIKAA